VAASLLMSHIHATFRTLLSLGTPVEDLLARANRLFSRSTMPSHFATVACGFAHPSGEIEICNAGHCPPLVLRDHGVEPVEATGLPLGLFSDQEYSASRLRLSAGDGLLLYTDGLTEARNPTDDEYGLDRVVALLPGCRKMSPEQMLGSCLEDLSRFLCGAQKTDDLTVMAIRRE
jgi:phosphoserine phosphatase RsbU/P